MIAQSVIATLNTGLLGKRIRNAGIDAHGTLWVRSAGRGEDSSDLAAAMDQADAYLASKGFRRDPTAPIFRQGLDWGQRIVC